MKKYRSKLSFKDVFFAFGKRVLQVVGIAVILGLVLSIFLPYKYGAILKILSFIIIIIGMLSVLGGTGTTFSTQYNWHKSTTRMTDSTREDIKLLQGSYSFCIFMGIAGGVTYLISYIISFINI